MPGNIRRAEHFVAFLRRFVLYLKEKLGVNQVETENPTTFLAQLQDRLNIDGKPYYTGLYLTVCTYYFVVFLRVFSFLFFVTFLLFLVDTENPNTFLTQLQERLNIDANPCIQYCTRCLKMQC